jgi:hypothetical protein
MATRKKGAKRNVKRFEPEKETEKPQSKPKPSIGETAPMKPRMKESNEGFGVLKGVGVLILALIVGSAILFNRAGGREAMRGDKSPGEHCEKTVECARGSICYAYKNDRPRCLTTCSKKRPCDPQHACVTAASQKRKKGIRLADICVKNEDI